MLRAFQELPRERWPAVFAYVEPIEAQYPLLQQMDEEDGRYILQNLLPDDLTALLESLSQEEIEQLFKLLSPGRSSRP